MESGSPPAAIGKRLLRIVRAIYYMLRKGIPKSKLLLDLHLVLKRGKLAGKVLTSLLTLFHHHHHHQTTDSKEVQFSCTNTPSYPKKRNSRRRQDDSFDADALALAFAMMNAEQVSDAGSPAVCRKLRITDSPFPIQEEAEEADAGRIDRAADEFIKKFYEQLRCQQLASAAATPVHFSNAHRR